MNNPPAFPNPVYFERDTDRGMTLRDYFAAAAITGFNACPSFSDESHESVARMAYEQADAMLKAREG